MYPESMVNEQPLWILHALLGNLIELPDALELVRQWREDGEPSKLLVGIPSLFEHHQAAARRIEKLGRDAHVGVDQGTSDRTAAFSQAWGVNPKDGNPVPPMPPLPESVATEVEAEENAKREAVGDGLAAGLWKHAYEQEAERRDELIKERDELANRVLIIERRIDAEGLANVGLSEDFEFTSMAERLNQTIIDVNDLAERINAEGLAGMPEILSKDHVSMNDRIKKMEDRA